LLSSNCEAELPESAPIVSPEDIGRQIRTKKKKPINSTSNVVFRHSNGEIFAEDGISKPNTPKSKQLQSISLSKKSDTKFASGKKIEDGQVPVMTLVDPKIFAVKKPRIQIQSRLTANVERIIP
jgi:hypothetical protein